MFRIRTSGAGIAIRSYVSVYERGTPVEVLRHGRHTRCLLVIYYYLSSGLPLHVFKFVDVLVGIRGPHSRGIF